jgi:hypothetical protein
MNAFVAVFRRELAAQRPMLLTAGALVLLAGSSPWWPTFASHDPVEARTAVAFALTVIGGPLLALLVGASLFARDLADGRLGFYFARPISTRALWLGKLAAGGLVALVAVAVFMLLSLTGIASMLAVAPWPLFLGALAIAGVCVLLGHHIAVAARARSPWLLLDFIALLVIIPLVWGTLTGLWQVGAHVAMTWAIAGFVLATTTALFAAGFLALRSGRSDLGRTHRRQAVAFWPLACLATLGLVGYARWVTGATPQDLHVVTWLDAAPTGPWVAISGVASGRGDYRPRFLLDTVSGRYLRADKTLRLPTGLDRVLRNGRIIFSGDGRRAAWQSQAGAEVHLAVVDLASGRLMVDDQVDGWVGPLALDATGDRLFYFAGQRVMVRGTSQRDTPHELVRLPVASASATLRILDTGELAIGVREDIDVAGPGYRLWRVDPRSGKNQEVRIAVADGLVGKATLSSDGTRLLLEQAGLATRLVDSETGVILRELPPTHGWDRTCLMNDGGAAYVTGSRGHLELTVIDRYGRDRLRLALPAVRFAWLVGERRPGRLLFGAVSEEHGWQGRWLAREVDLASGTVLPAGDDDLELVSDDVSSYFLSGRGELVAAAPDSDAKRVVLRGLQVRPGDA